MMDQERKEHLLKSHKLGMRRYILVHGVINWGVSTALIYRSIVTIASFGWSLNALVNELVSTDTLVAIVFFALVGVVFGFGMWKYIDRTVSNFPPEPEPKTTKGKGKNKKK